MYRRGTLPPVRQRPQIRPHLRHPIRRQGYLFFFRGTQEQFEALEETNIQDMLNNVKVVQQRFLQRLQRYPHQDSF